MAMENFNVKIDERTADEMALQVLRSQNRRNIKDTWDCLRRPRRIPIRNFKSKGRAKWVDDLNNGKRPK